MKSSIYLILLISLGIALIAMDNPSRTNPPGEEELLLKMDREWSEAGRTNDIDKLVSYWHDDAVVYPSIRSPIRGKEAIREFVTENRKQPGHKVNRIPQFAKVAASGDVGYTTGLFIRGFINDKGESVKIEGNYVCVWEKFDGNWKSVISIVSFGRD